MIEISKSQLNFIKKQAKQELPYEACGILLGDGKKVTAVIKAKNVSPAPRYRYIIDPEIELKYRNQTMGYYHSHPDSGHQASKIDQMMFIYGKIYIIYGLKDDLFGAFKNDEDFVGGLQLYKTQGG